MDKTINEAVHFALEDVDDDAARCGGIASQEDLDRAAARHELDSDEWLLLTTLAIESGLIRARDSESATPTKPISAAKPQANFDEPASSIGSTFQEFIKHTRSYPLIDARREAELARAYEAGQAAKAKADVDGLTDALLEIIERGDAAKKEFFLSNLRLVVKVGKGFYPTGMDRMDVIQAGMIGLNRAVELFDWRQGFKFSTYATNWIYQAIQRELDNHGRLIRIPVHRLNEYRKVRRCTEELEGTLGREPTIHEIAEKADMAPELVAFVLDSLRPLTSLDKVLLESSDDTLVALLESDDPSPEELVAFAETVSGVRAALNTLEPRQREVVEMRFGMGGDKPATLDEVARHMGITRERVRQLETEARKTLKKTLRARNLTPSECFG